MLTERPPKVASNPAVTEATAVLTRLVSEFALIFFDFLQSNPSDLMLVDSDFLSKPVRPLPSHYTMDQYNIIGYNSYRGEIIQES